MQDYEERRRARIDRYKERAERARANSQAMYGQAKSMASAIPFGQPILVGHHSEKADRRFRQRIENRFRKSFEEQGRAEYWEERAKAAERNEAISSQDPHAIEKIKERIEALEWLQDAMKAVNAAHRAYLSDPASLDTAQLTDRQKELVRVYKPVYSWEPHPCPPYRLQNNNANIRRLKKRLAELEKWTAEPAREEIEGVGARVVENEDLNGVEIHFDEKPEPAVLEKLRLNGWKWSRRSRCWYARRSDWTRQFAAELVLGMTEPQPTQPSDAGAGPVPADAR
jgi:hypothetical protein